MTDINLKVQNYLRLFWVAVLPLFVCASPLHLQMYFREMCLLLQEYYLFSSII